FYSVDLSVVDITGKEVLRKQFYAAEKITFDMSNKVSGMYFVQFQSNETCLVQQFQLADKNQQRVMAFCIFFVVLKSFAVPFWFPQTGLTVSPREIALLSRRLISQGESASSVILCQTALFQPASVRSLITEETAIFGHPFAQVSSELRI
ncbi:MAG: T9SS type A sorting domain-containing protein, partial [Prolixibacteraceae bacterium]|nr:T9SS type A sorting domain-containing protein [Prolixibacteraceae bacterium]